MLFDYRKSQISLHVQKWFMLSNIPHHTTRTIMVCLSLSQKSIVSHLQKMGYVSDYAVGLTHHFNDENLIERYSICDDLLNSPIVVVCVSPHYCPTLYLHITSRSYKNHWNVLTPKIYRIPLGHPMTPTFIYIAEHLLPFTSLLLSKRNEIR